MLETLHRNNPKMMSNNPFPSRPTGFENHRFDASQGSNVSQHYQHRRNQTSNLHGSGSFDELKNSGIPSHLQPRNIPSNEILSENLITAQTKATTMENNQALSEEYEIPRNNNQATTLSPIISAIPENNQSTNSKNS
uniref:Uncharacterized protein n=1 Tax=Panagrolaimus superbus TaxID=310955 RepID=A0A914Z7B3_9BILA